MHPLSRRWGAAASTPPGASKVSLWKQRKELDVSCAAIRLSRVTKL